MKESLRSLCCDMGNAYSRNFSLERLYSGIFGRYLIAQEIVFGFS